MGKGEEGGTEEGREGWDIPALQGSMGRWEGSGWQKKPSRLSRSKCREEPEGGREGGKEGGKEGGREGGREDLL